MHTFLKRSVYKPARRVGLPSTPAALLTFVASGLLHEYTFSIHNAPAYEPGKASLFFAIMGVLMMAEAALGRLAPRAVVRAFGATPSWLVAQGLILISAIPMQPFFFKSWLGSGMVDSVAALVPQMRCAL